MTPLLSVKHLSRAFGGVAAVADVSFDIPRGSLVALIGPNGAGKTTVLNLLNGTITADDGSIKLENQQIFSASIETRARLGISRTFQLSRAFRNLTVRDHLLLASSDQDDAILSGWKTPRISEDELEAALRRVFLDVPLETPARALSYGQGKLLQIAMALLRPHRLLLCDEPVAGVNPVLRDALIELFQRLRTEGETMLLVEHDLGFVRALADQVIAMENGRIIANGTPQEVFANEHVIAAYVGT